MEKNLVVGKQFEDYNIQMLLDDILEKTVSPEDHYEIADWMTI